MRGETEQKGAEGAEGMKQEDFMTMDTLTDYDQFIAGKTRPAEWHGFEPAEFTAPMKPFQQLAVSFALRRGRAALFEDTGLGKTRQLAEWAHQVMRHTDAPVLIFTKLAVTLQTIAEAEACGIAIREARQPEDVDGPGIYVTNYERLNAMQEGGVLARLGGVVLDESSILKNFTGRMSSNLREWCAGIPFRLCATATPAPNDFTELGQHAEFLGVMAAPQMLATWFINDTQDTGAWRLKGHARADFWRWVSTWAACIFKPSDVGDSDEGYVLPPLAIEEVRFDVPQPSAQRDESGEFLFDTTVVNAANIAKEAARTIGERAQWIAGTIADAPDECWAVFVETNEEADAIGRALDAREIDGWVEVRGSDRDEHKKTRLWQFTRGEKRVIVTKSEIAGFGLNWQHCARVIFASPDYSFEQWYQAVRRFYRFGQKRPVVCYMLRGENMERVADVWRGKMAQFEAMKEEMRTASAQLAGEQKPGMVCHTDLVKAKGEGWTLYHGDCVRMARTLPDGCIDFSVFSPPFADLFTYSNDVQDMGNCASMEDFMAQFRFLIVELLRVTAPGRHAAVHCVDLLATKWKDGYMGYKDFSGAIVRAFMECGWTMWSRITIWKCPVVEMTRTKAHGLLHKTLKKDSADSRMGSAEYLLVFRKPGENARPITHTPESFPVSLWQEMASPVWLTVDQGDVLNSVKEQGDERHICPLQKDVIRRALAMWSTPGDLVFSPFTGIGSEGYESLLGHRRFIGAELKHSYWKQACANLERAAGLASMELMPPTVSEFVKLSPAPHAA